MGFRDYSGATAFEYYDNATSVDDRDRCSCDRGLDNRRHRRRARERRPHHRHRHCCCGRRAARGRVGHGVQRRLGRAGATSGRGQTGSDGTYDIGGLPTGTYRVGFEDYSGEYVGEYYDDAASVETATDVPVTAGDHDREHRRGALHPWPHLRYRDRRGRRRAASADVLGRRLQAVHGWRRRFWWRRSTGPTRRLTAPTTSAASSPAPTASASATSPGSYLGEYYDDAASVQTATDVPVTVGSTTGSIDAALANAGHITGTVTAAVGRSADSTTSGSPVYQRVDEGCRRLHVGRSPWHLAPNPTARTMSVGWPPAPIRVGFRVTSRAGTWAEYYDDAASLDGRDRRPRDRRLDDRQHRRRACKRGPHHRHRHRCRRRRTDRRCRVAVYTQYGGGWTRVRTAYTKLRRHLRRGRTGHRCLPRGLLRLELRRQLLQQCDHA